MTEDQTFIVGEVLPRIASVSVHQGFHVAVTWEDGSRAGRSDVVDLGPAIMTYKPYAPLRDNPELFRTVHVINYGTALGWGNDDDIDMSAEGVEDLVEQAMTAADFKSFMERHKFSQDAAAAQLGISRRQINYFLSSKAIPRTVALACGYLDLRASGSAPVDEPIASKAHEMPTSPGGIVIDSFTGSGSYVFITSSGTMKKPDTQVQMDYRSLNVRGADTHRVVSPADATYGKSDVASLPANKPVTPKR